MNIQSVVIELDWQQVSLAIEKDREDLSAFGSITRACKEVLKLESIYKVCFIGRQANLVTHGLARASNL